MWHDLGPKSFEQRLLQGSKKTGSKDSNLPGVEEGVCSSLKLWGPQHGATSSVSDDVLLPANVA
jgi:hypothetical protein